MMNTLFTKAAALAVILAVTVIVVRPASAFALSDLVTTNSTCLLVPLGLPCS